MNNDLKHLLIIPAALLATLPIFFMFSAILAILLEILGLKTKKQNISDDPMIELLVIFLSFVFSFLMIRYRPKKFVYFLVSLVIIFIILFIIYATFYPNPTVPDIVPSSMPTPTVIQNPDVKLVPSINVKSLKL